MTLPKMTGLPAQRLGWKDRGTLHEGAFADLVLFNPATVIAHATFAKPFELSTGVERVFVNGTLVWDASKPTGAKPGRALPHWASSLSRLLLACPPGGVGNLLFAAHRQATISRASSLPLQR